MDMSHIPISNILKMRMFQPSGNKIKIFYDLPIRKMRAVTDWLKRYAARVNCEKLEVRVGDMEG